MFFISLTFSFILMATGGYLLSAGNDLFGWILLAAGALCLFLTLVYYAARNKKRSRMLDCIDCGIPDCDLFDCDSDCDCGGPNCD